MTLFERLWRQRDAFRKCFRFGQWLKDGKPTQDATITLQSLARFCYADASAFDIDPRVHALKEGRREVWLEIVRVLELDDEALLKIKESAHNE